MLATPGPNGDAVLEAAVIKAAMAGLVAPRRHVVVLQQIHNDLCVKVRPCCQLTSCSANQPFTRKCSKRVTQEGANLKL
jgi:hypothetical protein